MHVRRSDRIRETPPLASEGIMSSTTRDWAPLPLRLLLGIGFVHHGWHNVIMADERQAFTWMLREIGIGQPSVMLWAISLVSFAGGLALLSGSFVRLACIPLALNVPAILFLIHFRSGFDFVKLTAVTAQGPQYGMPGYEVSLLYLAGLCSLCLSGAGVLSVDARRAESRRRSRNLEFAVSETTPRRPVDHRQLTASPR
jgi:putative oxidoreductase